MTSFSRVTQRQPLVLTVVAFLAGVIIGLVVLGWWLWPVQWKDASPADLQEPYQNTYLSMVADSYALTGDATLAKERVVFLVGPSRPLEQLSVELQVMAQQRTSASDAEGAKRLLALSTALGTPAQNAPSDPVTLPAPPRAPAPLLSQFLRICGLVILVLVVLAGLLLLVYFLQARTIPEQAPGERLSPATAGAETRSAVIVPATLEQPRPAVLASAQEPATLGPFVATYNLGDIDFDMSFGIESASGDFLGECGLGMAETIGGGEVQRVAAFEVWLFDKTDIRTVSIVLASTHANSDASLRTKLASRGEIILAQPGVKFAIQTSSLRLEGRILDLAYGGGDVPPQSYFTSFSVELVPAPLNA